MAIKSKVLKAITPEELFLSCFVVGPCPGDECNDDMGDCLPADAGCGQDCSCPGDS